MKKRNDNKKEETRTTIPVLEIIDMSEIDPTGLSSLFLPSADETTTDETSSTENFRLIDFGFNAGLGYEINNLHFNLMYSYGLLDYRDNNDGESLETLKTIRFSIAYLFLLGKANQGEARFKWI